ncbi:MAG TPA: hypothetical protein VLA89_07115 [Gemmatimonadales bacterium]|nr:hypothetical protein [Gemmatimonadales bacterium]
MMRQKIDVMQQRRVAVRNLRAIVLSDIPDGLPELPTLRLKISKVRALILIMEQTLQSLYEREVPRSLRMADPNGFLSHMESRVLVETALTLIQEAKKL